jgi:hypothetical protein
MNDDAKGSFNIGKDSREYYRGQFSANKYTRVADAKKIATDEEALRVTFAFPASGTAPQSYGEETMALTYLDTELASETKVILDNDGTRIVGRFYAAKLAGEEIHITLQFGSAAAYSVAEAGESTRLQIKYQNRQWSYSGPRQVTLQGITLAKVGMYSPSIVLRAPRRKHFCLTDEPVLRIMPIKHPDGKGNLGNFILTEALRRIYVERMDEQIFSIQDETDSAAFLNTNIHLGCLNGRKVYPSINGLKVVGALPLGRIEDTRWDTSKDCAGEIEGQAPVRIVRSNAWAGIEFFNTPAGNKELAAWTAKEKRGIAASIKTYRYSRRTEGQDNIVVGTDWKPLEILIEGGTVLTRADHDAAIAAAPPPVIQTAPAPVPAAGFFQRIGKALSPKAVTA